VLKLANAREIVEIGAEHGGMTRLLADFCAQQNGNLIAIDPEPGPGFVAWAATHPHVRHIPQPSIEVIGELSAIDAWLIDGDHNYYTVLHELQAADALARRDGRPLLAILHDVGWPCARRDMYYAPKRIPQEYRRPHSHNAGVTPDNPGYRIDRGFRGSGNFAWALQQGGTRNGVLTAIEDFCREAETPTRRLLYAHVPAVFGLGVLFDANAPWAAAVTQAVTPYHDNPLLAKLELNRLTNYLTVLDWQDGYLARTGPACFTSVSGQPIRANIPYSRHPGLDPGSRCSLRPWFKWRPANRKAAGPRIKSGATIIFCQRPCPLPPEAYTYYSTKGRIRPINAAIRSAASLNVFTSTRLLLPRASLADSV